MSAAEFVFDMSGADRLLRTDWPSVMEKPMAKFGRGWINELVEQRMNGRPGVNRRTGNLARDWNSLTVRDATGVSLVIATHGTGDKYAGLQEYGGTVKPIKAKWLWIPTQANQTPAGVARVTPTQAISAGGFFSKNVFFARPLTKNTKAQASHLGGLGYKGAQFARGESLVALFVLKKSVTVPARLGAREKLAKDAPRLAEAVASAIQVAANG